MKPVLTGCLLLLFVGSLSAFTKHRLAPNHSRSQTTYVYTGDNTLSQQRDAQWYIKDNDALPCSGSEQKICLVVTDSDEGDHPDFSSGNPVDNPSLFDQVSKRPFE